ncbi:UNVERIFIED_ORG: hypothetical protein BDU10_2515 [Burkholderia sp. CF145]
MSNFNVDTNNPKWPSRHEHMPFDGRRGNNPPSKGK